MRLTISLLRRASSSKYFQRYIQRVLSEDEPVARWNPLSGWHRPQKEIWIYDKYRPWTDDFKLHSRQMAKGRAKPRRPLVEPIEEWDMFKGDVLFGLSPGVVRLGTLQSPWPIRRSSTVPEGVLLGVGNPLLDLTIRADQDFLDKYGLRPNDAIIAKPIHEKMFQEMMRDYSPVYIAGGATQNAIRVAQWILRRPKATVFFGCVGADAAAEILWKKAEEAGVQVCYQVDGKRQTGLCGSVITGEDRSLVARLGAADYLTHMFIEEAPNWARVQAAQCFYISGFVFPVCSQSIFDIAAHACDAHKIMAMNLSAPFLCKYYADTSWDIMPYIDVLFGNEMEAALFGKLRGLPCDGLEDIARATALLPKLNPKRPRTVVFTGGRRPTVVARGSEVTVFPVEAIDPALIQDTNGCGDAFVGGFLAQLVQGHSLEESLRCGNYCAKVVIQHWGCAFPQQHDYE